MRCITPRIPSDLTTLGSRRVPPLWQGPQFRLGGHAGSNAPPPASQPAVTKIQWPPEPTHISRKRKAGSADPYARTREALSSRGEFRGSSRWFKSSPLGRGRRRSLVGVDRASFAMDLMDHINSPSLINQRDSSLCGPACFLYALLQKTPETYAQFVIDLYEKGQAKVGGLDRKSVV